jgi:ATP-dependent protease ClpP protease subunit
MTGRNITLTAIGASLILGCLLAGAKMSAESKAVQATPATTITATENTTVSEVTTSVLTANTVTSDVSSKLVVKKLKASGSKVIYFNVPVSDQSVAAAINILKGLDGEIFLILDSPGGSVVDGAKLIEYIKYSGKDINTVCDGVCASMAFQIFEVGKKRLMSEKAILMAHPASGGAQGTIENMKSMIDAFKLLVDRMDKETADRAKIDYAKFKAMVSDNIWAETPEALKLGLADAAVHLEVTDTVFSNASSTDVREVLRKQGKLTPELLSITGYTFTNPAITTQIEAD